jgi:hypothetical protein
MTGYGAPWKLKGYVSGFVGGTVEERKQKAVEFEGRLIGLRGRRMFSITEMEDEMKQLICRMKRYNPIINSNLRYNTVFN